MHSFILHLCRKASKLLTLLYQKKVFDPEGGWELEQAAQESAQTISLDSALRHTV